MLLRSDIQITTIIKSLEDVIAPALGSDHKVAAEQVSIIIGQLRFMEDRAPLQRAFDRDELQRLVNLAIELEALGGGEAPEVDDLATNDGPEGLLSTIRMLRSFCASATTALYEAGGETRTKLAQAVISYTKEQVLRDRAWVVGQGWEADPTALPDIVSLLSEQAETWNEAQSCQNPIDQRR